MEAFRELGLYSRGIKTRLNDQGENYYGILRYGTQYDVNTVLIEHCHLDQVNDQPFYQKERNSCANSELWTQLLLQNTFI